MELRPVTRDEIGEFRSVISGAFGEDPPDDDGFEDRFESKLPLERTRAMFSDRQLVATSGTFPLTMNVPGGTIDCAGTTMVSVLPSHRRRGILTSMITALHDDAREREEPIAALWASESGIYGRYGYGPASDMVAVSIPGGRVRVDTAHDAEPVRFIDPGIETTNAFLAVESRDRPGWFHRSESWLSTTTLRDTTHRRGRATAYKTVITGEPSDPSGVVRYRTKPAYDTSHPGIEVDISQLWGSTPAAWADLWGFVLGIDLVTTITGHIRPVDDPLFHLATEPRRVERTLTDGLWVVLLDVGRALVRRRYTTAFAATIDVRDRETSEIWRLEVDRDGATCQPTTTSPDATMDRRRLGEAYMGRPRFSEGVRAGVIEMDPRLAAAADLAFSWPIHPFCPEIF